MAARDLGGYVAEAKRVVAAAIERGALVLPDGTFLEWTGQYELMAQMIARMKIAVPATLMIIVLLLYLYFRNLAEVLIVLLSIPFALVGSVWLLWLLDYHLSTAVWVGVIALVGLAAQTGIVMIVYLEETFHTYKDAGRMRTQHDLFEAITYGAVQRVRPKLMTVSTMLLGLLPLLWAHGAGADVMQRIAAPMIGGLITSSILTLEIVPAIYSIWRGRQVEWVKGPRPPRKSWDELSERFHEAELLIHGRAARNQ
jgi:Cu(I)/Ag(I) efflux system membrane protein CusA/SilA